MQSVIPDEKMWRGTRLLVVGDSHARFWRGNDGVREMPDSIPGVLTCETPGAIAFNLLNDNSTMLGRQKALAILDFAQERGFDGWLMLSFGEIDLRVHVFKHAPRIGLIKALQDIVHPYVGFIEEIQNRFKKVAVWAPIASQSEDTIYMQAAPTVGSEVERNFATMVFTKILECRLAAKEVPVLSLLPLMIGDDGRTLHNLLHDDVHASQVLMPSALDLVRRKLGLQLRLPASPLEFSSYVADDFTYRGEAEINGKIWLMHELRNAFHFKEIRFPVDETIELGNVDVMTSIDGENCTSYCLPVARLPDGRVRSITLDQISRFLYIRSDVHRFAPVDVELRIATTRLAFGSKGNGCNRRIMEDLSRITVREMIELEGADATMPSIQYEGQSTVQFSNDDPAFWNSAF